MSSLIDSAAQIRAVLTRWMQLDDRRQDAAWLDDCVTADFDFRVGRTHLVGRAAIEEFNQARDASAPRGVHILSEPLVQVDNAEATVTTDYLYVRARVAGGYEIALAGRYEDMFVRCPDGRWRCSQRVNVRHHADS